MNALARIFGFDVIDPAATAKALERSWHASMVADGLIREPGSRTRDGDAA